MLPLELTRSCLKRGLSYSLPYNPANERSPEDEASARESNSAPRTALTTHYKERKKEMGDTGFEPVTSTV